jgi:hypothetical protein
MIRKVMYPVSPLTYEPRLPPEKRFIYAGVADRVARPDQARALWRHWGKPEIEWLPSGHVLATMKDDARPFLRRIIGEHFYAKSEAPFVVDAESADERPLADAS